MKPSKTLHLTSLFNHESGGIATFYRALMRRAAETGREMVMVVPGAEDGMEPVSATVRIYRVKASRSLIGDRRYRVLLPHHFLFPGRTRFKQILLDEQPDVVEACDKYSLFYLLGYYRLGWVNGTSIPATVALSMERMDDNFSAYFNGGTWAMRFCRWYTGKVYFRIPKYHIAISSYVAGELEAAPRAKDLNKVRLLPLGVDSVTFSPPDDKPLARRRLLEAVGVPAGKVASSTLLLYAGRLSQEKNTPLLTDTLSRLCFDLKEDCHLVLIGGGMLRDRLEREARGKFRGRLHLLPHVGERQQLAEFIGGADIFIHPNPKEPFGIGPLEAMSCGLPVLLPSSGGVLEYANESNSWLAKPNAEAFASAILQIRKDHCERVRRIELARQTGIKHDWTAVADRYFQQYEAFHEAFLDCPEPWPIPYRIPLWPGSSGLSTSQKRRRWLERA